MTCNNYSKRLDHVPCLDASGRVKSYMIMQSRMWLHEVAKIVGQYRFKVLEQLATRLRYIQTYQFQNWLVQGQEYIQSDYHGNIGRKG